MAEEHANCLSSISIGRDERHKRANDTGDAGHEKNQVDNPCQANPGQRPVHPAVAACAAHWTTTFRRISTSEADSARDATSQDSDMFWELSPLGHVAE